MVKTTGGQEYHGNIQVIHQGYFTVLPDFQSAPVQIAYSEVLAAAQNLSRAAKIAIGILAALAMYAIIYLVAD